MFVIPQTSLGREKYNKSPLAPLRIYDIYNVSAQIDYYGPKWPQTKSRVLLYLQRQKNARPEYHAACKDEYRPVK